MVTSTGHVTYMKRALRGYPASLVLSLLSGIPLLLRIVEVRSFNIGLQIMYPDCHHGFSQSLQLNSLKQATAINLHALSSSLSTAYIFIAWLHVVLSRESSIKEPRYKTLVIILLSQFFAKPFCVF